MPNNGCDCNFAMRRTMVAIVLWHIDYAGRLANEQASACNALAMRSTSLSISTGTCARSSGASVATATMQPSWGCKSGLRTAARKDWSFAAIGPTIVTVALSSTTAPPARKDGSPDGTMRTFSRRCNAGSEQPFGTIRPGWEEPTF